MEKKEQIDLLYKLKKEVEKSDNQLLVSQINEVIKKVFEDKKIISFVGHFSSGKSSLINYLMEEDILPSSPVPTTSNSAQLTIADKEEIIVNLENQEYAYAHDYDEVKKINTANQRIESVELMHVKEDLPLGLTLQDTPGIDATFSNHEQNTMKYLLTSDVIVYIVEYNHVESEKNFKEMKRLNELGMPLIFVINQIDKHNEEEIKFTDFKNSILNNLKTWDIQVEDILFTSIFEHDLNEVKRLKQLLFGGELLNKSHATFHERITRYITDEQLRYLEGEQSAVLDSLGLDKDSLEANRTSIIETQSLSEEQKLFETPNSTEQYFLKAIRDILKNAYLVPFEIREQIKSLLEVYSPDFKVGGFFGKEKKREEIRNREMTAVLDAINDSIEKQVNFHIRDLYDQHAKYTNGDWLDAVRHYRYALVPDDLISLMNHQAIVTNDYVLNYTDQLKKYIEQAVVRENRAYIELFIKNLNMSKMNPSESHSAQELAKYDELTKLVESLTTRNYQHYYIHIDESIDRLIDRKLVTLEMKPEVQELKKETKVKARQTNELSQAVERLDLYSRIPYFNDMTQRLRAQLERIHHDVTRIVVFGAFSAGKSSLINAMLGDKYLVSSPNPTTAAITELSYGHTHSVKFKTEQMLLDELNKIGRTINIEAASVTGWLSQYNKQRPELDNQFKKFIHALEVNYNHYLPYLDEGQSVTIEGADIRKYTAIDEHSAFVDRIYLQYEIDFLKNKVIIDSPGIGSTNMRHTNETTEIIADSDLLIYVSYFNHVFTESDKQFISYLNSLQLLSEDSQTFYVINAIDLARNEGELQLVKDYFDSELKQLAVDSSLFELSSKKAMDERDDYFNRFMAAIQHFAEVDSRMQKITQFENGVRQIEKQAQYIIEHAEEARAQEATHRAFYQDMKKDLPFKAAQIDISMDKVRQELNEQLVYLKDRFRIQLYDLIKIYFNKRQVDQAGFTGELTNKIEEELSMIIPRLNYTYNVAITNQTAIIRQTLAEHHLIVALEEVKLLPINQNFFDVKLPAFNMKISNKSFNSKTALDQLYTDIHSQAQLMINDKLAEFKEVIENELQSRQPALTEQWQQRNDEVFDDIAEREQHQLDETVVNQIKEVTEGSYESLDR